jgi:predicted KAP-like P-loop ATPase
MDRTEGQKAAQAGGVTADRPRTRLEEDELGYRDFAEAIAAGLAERTGDDGLVVAIHGKWGSGKTTAVNMAIDALERREAGKEEDERTIVVRFNPWWFSEQKDLTRAFFTELTASIGKRLSSNVRDGLRTMAKKVTGAGELVSSILAWTPAGPAAKQIAELVKAAGEEIADERSLDDVRGDLAKALAKETRSIVVIIDDVDRLPGDEARQIFRLVKSVADLPRVTYLLVFDRDIATRALERPADAESPEWLEKIVQASFDLPPVAQTNLNQLFVKRLVAIVGDAPIPNQLRWGNTFHGAIVPWLRTARDAGRLANAIAMAWPAVRNEVDVADFVAIETLRLFEPRLYSFVRNHGDELTGAEPHHTQREAREAFGTALLRIGASVRSVRCGTSSRGSTLSSGTHGAATTGGAPRGRGASRRSGDSRSTSTSDSATGSCPRQRWRRCAPASPIPRRRAGSCRTTSTARGAPAERGPRCCSTRSWPRWTRCLNAGTRSPRARCSPPRTFS